MTILVAVGTLDMIGDRKEGRRSTLCDAGGAIGVNGVAGDQRVVGFAADGVMMRLFRGVIGFVVEFSNPQIALVNKAKGSAGFGLEVGGQRIGICKVGKAKAVFLWLCIYVLCIIYSQRCELFSYLLYKAVESLSLG